MDVSRRSVMGGALVALPSCMLAGSASSDPSRPPFHLAQEHADAWRFRSWTWRANAWHPLTGRIMADGAALFVAGRPDPRDAAALQAALGRIARDRSG